MSLLPQLHFHIKWWINFLQNLPFHLHRRIQKDKESPFLCEWYSQVLCFPLSSNFILYFPPIVIFCSSLSLRISKETPSKIPSIIIIFVCFYFSLNSKEKKRKNNLLGGESNPGQPGDSRLYLTTILPKISHY